MFCMSRLSKAVCAAAVSFSLFASVAAAQDGYVDVRVASDSVNCGAVVLKWPLDQPRQDYIPLPIAVEDAAPAVATASAVTVASAVRMDEPPEVEPIINEPATELAETTPIPVIHQHPALNAGTLFFPPADGYYRHYAPEQGQSPYTWRADKGQYEGYLRHTFPYYDERIRPGVVESAAGIPAGQGVAFQPAPVRREETVDVEPAVGATMVKAGFPYNVWVAPGEVHTVVVPAKPVCR